VRTFGIAVLTAAVGTVLALVGGSVATEAHRVSNMEGGRAVTILFLIAPAGFLAGLVIGLIAARSVGDPGAAGWTRAQGIALGATAALAVAVFGYALLRAPRAPQLDGQYLDFDFEVRMPPGRAAPDTTQPFSVLLTSRGSGDDRANATLRLDATTTSEGRLVIPARAFLRTSTTRRFLVVNDVDGKYYWFDLPLRARPRAEDQRWTAWWPKPGQSATSDIHGNGGFQIRYRVEKTERR
jgi:hypothetical protein